MKRETKVALAMMLIFFIFILYLGGGLAWANGRLGAVATEFLKYATAMVAGVAILLVAYAICEVFSSRFFREKKLRIGTFGGAPRELAKRNGLM